MNQAIDISAGQRKTILGLLRRYLPNTTTWVYGSRAKWTSRPQSDLDMVVFAAPEKERQVSDLREAFEESNLPFRVDLFVWDTVPEQFHEQIEAEHVVFVEKEERKMVGQWQEVALGDLVEIYDGPHATPKKTVSGPIFLGISNLDNGRLNLKQTNHLSEEDFKRWTRRVTPRKNDIVFSYETRLGEAGLIPPSLRCCLGRRIGLLRPKRDKIDARFLLYAFLGKRFQETLRSRTVHGSTVDRILLTEMGSFPIEIPIDIEAQRAIAHILGTLDDKIELNRRMNQTLEEMARALFKSWFVDFDPVSAKMEGRDTGLPPDVADLFPDRLVPSELGKIPERWEAKTLGDLCHKPQYGYTASAKSDPVGPKFLRITDINKQGWIDWDKVPYCEITEENLSKYRLYKGDVLIARMADPGHGVMIEENQKVVFASYLIRFRPIQGLHTRLLQYWLRSDEYWKLVSERGAGTTRSSLNAKVLSRFPLVVPSVSVATAFERQIASFRARVVNNASEVRTLTALRDVLLPKLILGDLRVKRMYDL